MPGHSSKQPAWRQNGTPLTAVRRQVNHLQPA